MTTQYPKFCNLHYERLNEANGSVARYFQGYYPDTVTPVAATTDVLLLTVRDGHVVVSNVVRCTLKSSTINLASGMHQHGERYNIYKYGTSVDYLPDVMVPYGPFWGYTDTDVAWLRWAGRVTPSYPSWRWYCIFRVAVNICVEPRELDPAIIRSILHKKQPKPMFRYMETSAHDDGEFKEFILRRRKVGWAIPEIVV